ncbi:MAG: ABC transporter permease, partial [Planctomycetia bacterium]
QLLLADEPTGNLDPDTGRSIVELLAKLSRDIGLTVLLVTHARELTAFGDRTLELVEGRLRDCGTPPAAAVDPMPRKVLLHAG